MPPKAAVDPNLKSYIYMKVVGGEVAAAAALAPKCSPFGLPPKKVVKVSRKQPRTGEESRFTSKLWSRTDSAQSK